MNLQEKNILFELFESGLGCINAARIVSSSSEAWDIYFSNNELDYRYNRFSLVYMCFPEDITSFWFRIYINPEKEELYLFYEKPSNTKFYLYDVEPVDVCMKAIPFKGARPQILEYLNNVFIPFIESYYKNSRYSLDKALGMAAVAKGDDAEALFNLIDARVVSEKKVLILPHEFLRCTRRDSFKQAEYPGLGEFLITEFKIMKNPVRDFFYLVSGSYIWTSDKDYYDRFCSRLTGSKVMYFLED